MRRAVTSTTKAIMLCTPNNPTGPALQHQEVIDFIDSVPDHIMIVLDEAYVEFVTDPKDCGVWMPWSDGRMWSCSGASPRRMGLPVFVSAIAWQMLILPRRCEPCRCRSGYPSPHRRRRSHHLKQSCAARPRRGAREGPRRTGGWPARSWLPDPRCPRQLRVVARWFGHRGVRCGNSPAPE